MVIHLCPLESFRGERIISETMFTEIIKKANTIQPSSHALDRFHKAMRAALPWDPKQPLEPESLTNSQRDAIHQSLFDCFTSAPKLATVP